MTSLYLGDILYLILVVPALICAFLAQGYVKSAFLKYSAVLTGYNSCEIVKDMLLKNNICDVEIVEGTGFLSDHFDSKRKIISLSDSVYDKNSISALGVACHEAGHALQHKEGYLPLKIRSFILPIVNFASGAALPIAMLGIIFSHFLIKVGIILFASTVIFQLLLLPIEFDASKRAVKELDISLDDNEINGVKKVLTAAALTYVASSLVAVANFLRIILIVNKRRK